MMNNSSRKARQEDWKRENPFPEVIQMTSRREKSKDARGVSPFALSALVFELIITECRAQMRIQSLYFKLSKTLALTELWNGYKRTSDQRP